MTNMPLPYISQWDISANENASFMCGPTSVAMVLNKDGNQVTPNKVFELTGAGKGNYITVEELQKALAALGYTSHYESNVSVQSLQSYLDQGKPCIAIVHAGNLGSRQDVRFTGGHILVVVGYRDDVYFVNDPDFWGNYRQDGDHHAYTKADFENAWKNATQDGNEANSLILIDLKTGVGEDVLLNEIQSVVNGAGNPHDKVQKIRQILTV